MRSILACLALCIVLTTQTDALTWEVQTLDSVGSVGGYTSLVVDNDGYARISYYDFSNGDLRYARWNGSYWKIETVDSTGDVGSYSSLVLDSDGYPRISYYDATNSDLKYASWDGTSWNIQVVDHNGGVGQYTSLVLNSSGYSSISYYDSTNANLKYAAWNGVSWVNETVDSPGNVGSYTSLAMKNSDNPCISYFDSTNSDLKYAERNGGIWVNTVIDSALQTGQYTSLALNSSGYPSVSYYDVTNGDLKYAAWTGNRWINETVAGTGNTGSFSSLVFSRLDLPCISFYDVTNADLKYAAWNGTTWITETVDSPGFVGYYTSLALDHDNYPHITYYDVTNGDLKYAQVYPPIIPGFSGTPLTGTYPLTVTFTDTTTGLPTEWIWYFGDGETSALQNPVHTYTKSGTFTVYLVAGNPHEGTNTTSRSDYIFAGSTLTQVVPSFTGSPVSGAAPLTVQFNGISDGHPDLWSWSFGDGGVSTEQNASHTYSHAGSYSVSLTAANGSGNATVTNDGYILVSSGLPIPNASFSGFPVAGDEPLSVQFNDTSTGFPSSWSWTFGDGTSSSLQNVSHTYTSAGLYTVYLTVTNEAGSDTASRTGYIRINSLAPPPVASFIAAPLNGTAPMEVVFSDTSSGVPATWLWYFGDGETAIDQNPSHIYTNAGTYTVYLTVAGSGGSNTTGKSAMITAQATGPVPVINFSGSPTSGSAPLTVTFNETSLNTPTSWKWYFGDGGSSTVSHPTWVYGTPGTYTIYLVATNAAGSAMGYRTDYVTVNPISAITLPGSLPVSGGDDNSETGPPPNSKDDLTFFVDSFYLESHHVMPSDIRMMSFTGSGWNDIPTHFTGSSGNRFYFTADSNRYSLLAIGNVKDGISKLPVIGKMESKSESGQRINQSIQSDNSDQKNSLDAKPLLGSPDLPRAPVSQPLQSNPFPGSLFIFAVIGAGCSGLATGGLLLRRWLIRRQNPSLFRKYD